MQVKEAMTTGVELVSPTHTIRQAALLMGKTACGAPPVADKDSLIGMICQNLWRTSLHDQQACRLEDGSGPSAARTFRHDILVPRRGSGRLDQPDCRGPKPSAVLSVDIV